VPQNAPQGAFYYVYRRLVDPNDNSKILFETIDHAFVQGTGANEHVVTASRWGRDSVGHTDLYSVGQLLILLLANFWPKDCLLRRSSTSSAQIKKQSATIAKEMRSNNGCGIFNGNSRSIINPADNTRGMFVLPGVLVRNATWFV
jgi:hypothetical protein